MSEHHSRHDTPSPASASLPTISEGVLKRFLTHPPDFETLYKRLAEHDTQLAGWLLAKTEQMAPANAAEKERYGTVALCLYGMLVDQQLINQLDHQFSGDTPLVVDGETVPPTIPD